MKNRFKFRATFSASYYDENGNDKDIKLTVYDVAVYSGGEIGFSAQQMETIIDALKLSEIEKDSIWQFINDNYATSSYEWFVCDNAIIDQCTGLSDKIGNLIYEDDILEISMIIKPSDKHKAKVYYNEKKAVWQLYHWDTERTTLLGDCLDSQIEIIGNTHEQKDK